eukprot:TRINITY_DN68992_c0_g1_i1.p1 TRINITY_DN68992_c0_g1~~TRINITY_DN68992_c0_g1_i1.p1  ORF type:complete len:563 (+),score=59.49 TRINITY_DN68992_c0_g1_i1:248-1690(+)
MGELLLLQETETLRMRLEHCERELGRRETELSIERDRGTNLELELRQQATVVTDLESHFQSLETAHQQELRSRDEEVALMKHNLQHVQDQLNPANSVNRQWEEALNTEKEHSVQLQQLVEDLHCQIQEMKEQEKEVTHRLHLQMHSLEEQLSAEKDGVKQLQAVIDQQNQLRLQRGSKEGAMAKKWQGQILELEGQLTHLQRLLECRTDELASYKEQVAQLQAELHKLHRNAQLSKERNQQLNQQLKQVQLQEQQAEKLLEIQNAELATEKERSRQDKERLRSMLQKFSKYETMERDIKKLQSTLAKERVQHTKDLQAQQNQMEEKLALQEKKFAVKLAQAQAALQNQLAGALDDKDNKLSALKAELNNNRWETLEGLREREALETQLETVGTDLTTLNSTYAEEMQQLTAAYEEQLTAEKKKANTLQRKLKKTKAAHTQVQVQLMETHLMAGIELQTLQAELKKATTLANLKTEKAAAF